MPKSIDFALLTCVGCARDFEKLRGSFEKNHLVTCPYCARLQQARFALVPAVAFDPGFRKEP